MKKNILILSIIIFTKLSFAQIELKGTMGINLISVTSAQDYINQNYAPYDDELNTFNTAVIFTGEVGYFFNEKFEMSVDLPYQIFSYNTNIEGAGQYDLYFDTFMPSVMAYYVLSGVGYNFKFGGGVGPRFSFVTEEKKWQGTSEEFTSTGFGGVLRIEGNTSLAENVYANIGADMRYDVNGEPENDKGNNLVN
ncbi:MAG: hypothetical protein OQJ78_02830, partial [Ignavibacteriaceae bacterium]|nr:hypothetical protein [Ignavibacteriaceae bacterium]